MHLRQVPLSHWKMEQDVDQNGLKKVFELEVFPGVFKDANGATYDLRPMDSCPSLNNFTRMERRRLQELLQKAYDAQMEELEHDGGYDRAYEEEVKRAIKKKLYRLQTAMKWWYVLLIS